MQERAGWGNSSWQMRRKPAAGERSQPVLLHDATSQPEPSRAPCSAVPGTSGCIPSCCCSPPTSPRVRTRVCPAACCTQAWRAGAAGGAHRFVGPVVLLEDVLHPVLAAVREHHDHLVAVGPRDVGLRGRGTAREASWAGWAGGRREAGCWGLQRHPWVQPALPCEPAAPLPSPPGPSSRSAAGRRRTRSRPCSRSCPWPPSPARPP